jgi:cytochrome P450
MSDPAQGFVAQYNAISNDPSLNPAQKAAAHVGLVMQWQGQPAKLGAELRVSDASKIFATPIGYLVSTYPDTVEAFSQGEAFSVCGYGERMANIAGAFMLGMDASPSYEHESSVMHLVAPSSDLTAIAAWLETFGDKVVAGATAGRTTLDVVPAVANRVPLGFIGHYFGVPGPDDATFMTWLQAAAVYIFEFWTNQFPAIETVASSMGLQFGLYLDGLIQSRLAALATSPGAVPNDVLTRLLGLLGPDPTTIPPHAEMALGIVAIRRNLAGFSIGCAVPPSGTIANALQFLLQPANADALAMTRAAARADDDDLLGQCMMEAARLGSPSPPSLFRTCTEDYILGRGTPRAKTIPKGSIVALYPAAAMTDADFIDAPLEFRPGRPASSYVLFGEGQHTCFGAAIGKLLLTYAAKPLLKLAGLHEVSPMARGNGMPGQFYPGSYVVGFTAA